MLEGDKGREQVDTEEGRTEVLCCIRQEQRILLRGGGGTSP
jgi:hypothetical protein